MEDLNNNDDNGDYYFYVSQPTKMKIMKNSLTQDVVDQEPITSIVSNLVTSIGEVIITADDQMYQAAKENIEPLGEALMTSRGDVVITTDDEVYQVVK